MFFTLGLSFGLRFFTTLFCTYQLVGISDWKNMFGCLSMISLIRPRHYRMMERKNVKRFHYILIFIFGGHQSVVWRTQVPDEIPHFIYVWLYIRAYIRSRKALLMDWRRRFTNISERFRFQSSWRSRIICKKQAISRYL